MKKATINILKGGEYEEFKTFEKLNFNILTKEGTLVLSWAGGDLFAGPAEYFMIVIDDIKN